MEKRKPAPPEGYENWLHYCVANFDARSAELPFMFDFDEDNPINRYEIEAALWDDFNALRVAAGLPKAER